MQIVESKYRAEDVRRGITSILNGKRFILERCATFYLYARQIRNTEIGIILIAGLASAFIYFRGLFFWQYRVFYAMCAAAFIFVILYTFENCIALEELEMIRRKVSNHYDNS